jgi:hypothetical protein
MTTTIAKAVDQVVALTTSAPASYSDPSGAFAAIPDTSVTFDLKLTSLLVVTFAGRGAAAKKPGQTTTPIVFVKCELDGTPCEPDANHVEFLLPPFCCDTRSFTWVARRVAPGSHKIAMFWGMGNPGTATLTNRSLIVEAARL